MSNEPLVSIVTPVYNTDAHLAECIESVLAQTYGRFEYIILDNASSDRSLQIAEGYTAKDGRIRVIACTEHLPQAGNYNRALAAIAPESVYVKMVQADDWIFPSAVESMVAVAEAHPRVGIVGALHLMGNGTSVEGTGLEYPCDEIDGAEIVRRELLEDSFHVLGTPSTLLYRASVVRARPQFFPEDGQNCDLTAGFDILRDWNFGFVHQVLAWLRESPDSISAHWAELGVYGLEDLIHLRQFGPGLIPGDVLAARQKEMERRYRQMLGMAVVTRKPASFWEFHHGAAGATGIQITAPFLARCVAELGLEGVRHPTRLWAAGRRVISRRG